MPGRMRLAVFSDVHGQIDRLSACLHSIARVGADELWCLGDTVDAFAVRQPELVVACVNAIDDVCAVKLTGNGEVWALQDGSLPDAAGTVLAAWTVAAHREGVLAVHGSPQNPLMGHLSDERAVRAAIDRLPGWLCVHGHTRQAGLWIRDKDGTLQRQRRPSSQKPPAPRKPSPAPARSPAHNLNGCSSIPTAAASRGIRLTPSPGPTGPEPASAPCPPRNQGTIANGAPRDVTDLPPSCPAEPSR